MNQEIIETEKYPQKPIKLSLDCLSDNEINTIKNSPIEINNIFESCKQELITKLVSVIPSASSPSLNQNDLYLFFVTIVVNRLAPYGNRPPFTKVEDLFNVPRLDCSGYAMLVGYLATLREENLADIDIHYIRTSISRPVE